jgi:hypothetical protein
MDYRPIPMSGFETDPLMQQWGQHPLVQAAEPERRRDVAIYLEMRAESAQQDRDDAAEEAKKSRFQKLAERAVFGSLGWVIEFLEDRINALRTKS